MLCRALSLERLAVQLADGLVQPLDTALPKRTERTSVFRDLAVFDDDFGVASELVRCAAQRQLAGR